MNRRDNSRRLVALVMVSLLLASLLSVIHLSAFIKLDAAAQTATPELHLLNIWGSTGSGNGQFDFGSRRGIAVDPTGAFVYVTDSVNHRVQKFQMAEECPEGTSEIKPGVCFVASLGHCTPDSNGVCTLEPGALRFPSGLAVDAAGTLYVADDGFDRIQKFDSQGNEAGSWGTLGTGDEQFVQPTDVAIDNAGFVYVTNLYPGGTAPDDRGLAEVKKFTRSGGFVTKWGTPCQPDFPPHLTLYPCNTDYPGAQELGDGQFTRPGSVDVDDQGNVYVADGTFYNGDFRTRVQIFNASNYSFASKIANAVAETSEIGDIALDSAGNIYVGDYGSRTLKIFSNSGSLLFTSVQIGAPIALAINPDSDRLYVADDANNRVLEFSITIPCTAPTAPPVAFLTPLLTPAYAQSASCGDLSPNSVLPIQAPTDSLRVAEGKKTLLKVQLENTFTTTKNVDIKITAGSSANSPSYTRIIENYPLQPGEFDYYLPNDDFIIPEGTGFAASVEVDPFGKITESVENNNKAFVPLTPVKDTGDLNILYVPLRFTGDSVQNSPTCDEVNAIARGSERFIDAIYPIADSSYVVDCGFPALDIARPSGSALTLTDDQFAGIYKDLQKLGVWCVAVVFCEDHYDHVVGVVRDDWFLDYTEDGAVFGATYPKSMGTTSVIVERGNFDGSTVAHEIAHVYSVTHSAEIASGYFVNERKPTTDTTLFTLGGSTYDFMFNSWARGGVPPGAPDNAPETPEYELWISATNYENLINELKVGTDPSVIGISGVISSDGTVHLDDSVRFEDVLDTALDNDGEYQILYQDSVGNTLAQTGFDVVFEIQDFDPPQVGAAPIALRIPDVEGTQKLVLIKGNQVLAESGLPSETLLVLDAIQASPIPVSADVSVTGRLVQSVDGAGIGSKSITFTGTGASELSPVVTDSSGYFAATGSAPSSKNNGWTVQAHFDGDSDFEASDSQVQSYDTKALSAQIEELEWIKQFGTIRSEVARGATVNTATGHAYVSGFTSGTLPGMTSLGSNDAFIRKYGTSGDEIWTRQFGTAGSDAANAISVNSATSDIYVGGNMGANSFIAKYDSDGSQIWTRQFGSGSVVNGVSVHLGTGDVYLAGTTGGALPGQTSSGGNDAFVRKYSSGGDEAWTKQFGSTGFEIATAISVDSASGNVIVVGWTTGTLQGQTSSGNNDAFVREYDSGGNVVWTKQFGGTDIDNAFGVSVDPSDGSVYVGGRTRILPGQTAHGLDDGFIIKFNSDGSPVWTRQFGTSNFDGVNGVAVNKETGDVYASGVSGVNAFVIKYDGTGNELGTRNFGTASGADSRGIAVNSETGSIFASGFVFGAFAGQTAFGSEDAFVAKLKGPFEESNEDSSPPIVTGTPDRQVDTSAGWYNHTLFVTWTGNDGADGSGISSCEPPSGYSGPDSASAQLTGHCTDNSSNTGEGTFSFKYDSTAPTISGAPTAAPNVNGWYNNDVVVHFEASDGTSGIESVTADVTLSAEGVGQQAQGTATDRAGNSADYSVTDINVDKTAPTITSFEGSISDGAKYYFGSVPANDMACAAEDSLSDIDGTCVVTGYETLVGSHILRATAKDKAGNTVIQEMTYEVLAWTIKGFYSPVDMTGVVNTIKSGQSVPLKFEVLAGIIELVDPAVGGTALNSFIQKKVNCNSFAGDPTDAIESPTTGTTSMKYDATTGQFVGLWKTPSNSANTCWEVSVTTLDGSSVTAYFKLTK